jgi:hypothetical protein
MSFSLLLNSSNVVGNNNNTFRYNFVKGSFNVPEDSEIIVSQITIPYSFGNVSAVLGNNTFTYVMPTTGTTATTNVVVLPDGFYDLNAINSALYADLRSKNYYFYNNAVSTITPSTGSTAYPNIIYPISFSSVYSLYTNSITFQYIPTSAPNVLTQYGTGWVWALGTFPNTATTPQVIITGVVSSTTTLFGNIVGFISGTYPSSLITYSGAPTIFNTQPYVILGNTLKASANNASVANPPFAPLATSVNSIVVHCDLVENNISIPSDVLDNFPINATYGSNISYLPIADNSMKLKSGTYQSLTISFTDQNFNPLLALDPNVSISLIIKFPSSTFKKSTFSTF